MWVLEGAVTQGHWVGLAPRDSTFTGSDVHCPTLFCGGLPWAYMASYGPLPHLLSANYMPGPMVQVTTFAVCLVSCTFHSAFCVCVPLMPTGDTPDAP